MINVIEERTSLPTDNAKGTAEAAVDFLKEQLPEPTASQIDGLLEENVYSTADAVGDATDRLKGMFGN